jgi:hypothetical protein
MRSTKALRFSVLAGVITAAGCGGGGSSTAQRDGEFRVTGSMALPRMDFTATRLADGRVLVVGGSNHPTTSASAEIYDPETGAFAWTGALVAPRAYHVAALLSDDQVLVVGGALSTSAELFDPVTGLFTATDAPAKAHYNGTATGVDDDVLVIGGIDFGVEVADIERYEMASGLFFPEGSLLETRASHSATRLAGGKILVVGGTDHGNTLASAELYDPMTGVSVATGSLAAPRTGHSATLLRDGRVLVVGGASTTSVLATAEIYDPAAGTFSPAGTMDEARYAHSAALLADGRVLVAGGYDFGRLAENGGILDGSELFDPRTRTFRPAARLHERRAFGATVVLADGGVLAVGGLLDWSGSGVLAGAEVYR